MPTLKKEQLLPGRTVGDVFDFFADAKNLERITPPWLNFHVKATSTENIREGTRIQYSLKIRGIPCRWESVIEEWQPGKQFVDRQLRGPYRKWVHLHTFRQVNEGVIIGDEIEYEVPLGILGQLVAGHLVRRDVEKIFEYRAHEIARILVF